MEGRDKGEIRESSRYEGIYIYHYITLSIYDISFYVTHYFTLILSFSIK